MLNQISDAKLLKRCFIAAAANVEKNKEFINELNVFPVPDGDTGTNVSMTLMSAVNDVKEASDDIESVCRAISQGALKGARGNSGVIFSQLLRGFTKALKDQKSIDQEILASGFKRAVETAYKAVMKPKEGTILTVARAMSDKINELVPSDKGIEEILEEVIRYGDETLNKTPEMLPVLKEAGVVDSGGMALMVAIKGAAAALSGKDGDLIDSVVFNTPGAGGAPRAAISTDEIRFAYCTECLINRNKGVPAEKTAELREFLLNNGDSVVCVEDDSIIKIHVHTNHPGLVFEKCLELGALSRIKVDNMAEEHEERLIRDASRIAAQQAAEEPEKDLAVVAVCAGNGLAETFRELGADYVIEGGQTMNPSIQDILDACRKTRAKEVIVLPNNKNIILASEQAGKNTEGAFTICTVPTKTVVQGISAILSYDPSASVEENAAQMLEGIKNVKSGEVTYAIRNTCVDGFDIKEGDIMGIGDAGILASGRELNPVSMDLIRSLSGKDASVITIYNGADVTEETAEELKKMAAAEYPMTDVDVVCGGQPVYYYFISVE